MPQPQDREDHPLFVVLQSLSEQPAAADTRVDDAPRTFDELRSLMACVEARDPFMRGHSERVSTLAHAAACAIGLRTGDLHVVRIGALLHDVGKIGVSDMVLRKPGALSPEELKAVRRHPSLGARILDAIPAWAAYLSIVELHHERPDGTGYPHGLRGEEIPLCARIVHVADAFDAMTSARAYRPARDVTSAIAELWRHRDSEFDRVAVEALIASLAQPVSQFPPRHLAIS